jgi:hypothetical protein
MYVPAAELHRQAPSPSGYVARLGRLHLSMLDALVAGEGLPRVAAIAAAALGADVALLLPALASASSSCGPGDARLPDLRRYVADRLIGRPAEVPRELAAEAPIASGGRALGAAVMLGRSVPDAHAADVLHVAALAAVTAVALETGAEHAAGRARAELIDDVRSGTNADGPELAARALLLGCDLTEGAIALVAEAPRGRAAHAAAAVAEEFPDALSQAVGERLYALLPARREREPAAITTAVALRLADRLVHSHVGVSSFARDPAQLHRLVREAEIAAALVGAGVAGTRAALAGTYRLMIALAAGMPEELEALHAATLRAVVEYDVHHRAELLPTFEAYLANGCNMNATAAAIHTHRHTVAYRLDRLAELTGLEPRDPGDREQLALAVKALAVVGAARAR